MSTGAAEGGANSESHQARVEEPEIPHGHGAQQDLLWGLYSMKVGSSSGYLAGEC